MRRYAREYANPGGQDPNTKVVRAYDQTKPGQVVVDWPALTADILRINQEAPMSESSRPSVQRITCQHNEHGEFENSPRCTQPAAIIVAWNDPSNGPSREFICDSSDHRTLLIDSVITVDDDVQVYQLVNVTEGAIEGAYTQITVEQGNSQPIVQITWSVDGLDMEAMAPETPPEAPRS